jgi:2-amino-4,5-dihydroxy-6-oxo-7-(phosphooxy)heptanoate synthase
MSSPHPMPNSFGRSLRLRRLHRHSGRLFVLPLDHAVSDGPFLDGGRPDALLDRLRGQRVDAVVLHKGCLRWLDPRLFLDTSVIVHLSASTARAPDPDDKLLVASVAEAVRLGADAVSVHVNIGSRQEAHQIADLATVAGACDRWNLPLLAMMYPRGPHTHDPRDPQALAHAVAVAAELGADVVKTVYPGSVAAMREVTARAPLPVLVAGGQPRAGADALLADVQDALDGGAAGVAIGRNIFAADDPVALTRKLAEIVHGRVEAIDSKGERS